MLITHASKFVTIRTWVIHKTIVRGRPSEELPTMTVPLS
nr:MAG TPA: hypothetical protein [Caudoviricetes sp.]